MKKLFTGIAVLAAAACSAASAQAQSTMLAPGVYTTPDISARCQSYVRTRMPNSGAMDSERQSIFLACVQRLSRGAGAASAAVAAPPPEPYLTQAPVALPASGYGGYASAPYSCATDEGYGRLGSCDTY